MENGENGYLGKILKLGSVLGLILLNFLFL